MGVGRRRNVDEVDGGFWLLQWRWGVRGAVVTACTMYQVRAYLPGPSEKRSHYMSYASTNKSSVSCE
jgi:hypothetical protein